jgi:hypothetical protein
MLLPGRRERWRTFLDGVGSKHAYMVHVGAGWAAARLRASTARFVSPRDPLLRWLVLDGMGFHEGYFHPQRTVAAMFRPSRIRGYALRAFDQGLGRSLWFVECADPARIAAAIARFDAERMSDLWAGVGLAAAYAGGVFASDLHALQMNAAPFAADLAQGAAFAAEARERAGNPAPHTELACSILCGLPAREAAAITVDARETLASEDGAPDYDIWRRNVRDRFLPLAAVRHA